MPIRGTEVFLRGNTAYTYYKVINGKFAVSNQNKNCTETDRFEIHYKLASKEGSVAHRLLLPAYFLYIQVKSL